MMLLSSVWKVNITHSQIRRLKPKNASFHHNSRFNRQHKEMAKIAVGTEGCTFLDIVNLARATEDCDLAFRSLTSLATSLKVSAVIERNSLSFHAGLTSPDTLFHDILRSWRSKFADAAALESVIEALVKAEMATLASALEEKYKLGKYANQDQPEKKEDGEDDDNDGCFPLTKRKRKPEPTSDCDDDDDICLKGDDVVDFRRVTGPLEVKISPPPQNVVKATKDFYKLPAANKGLALILNIMSFDKHGKRDGSQHDVAYMENLWSLLGYTVFPGAPLLRQERKTEEDVINLITNFKLECKKAKAKSIVVFIGSHGYYDKIVTSDEKRLDLHKDVISPFNKEKCPWLADKPKMFFVQACQQFEQTDSSMPKLPMDHSSLMIAQFPGFPANRNLRVGSWFSYCLTYIFMKYAHKLDLKKLMKKAQTMLAEAEGASDYPQQARITDDGIATLYFNMNHS